MFKFKTKSEKKAFRVGAAAGYRSAKGNKSSRAKFSQVMTKPDKKTYYAEVDKACGNMYNSLLKKGVDKEEARNQVYYYYKDDIRAKEHDSGWTAWTMIPKYRSLAKKYLDTITMKKS